MLLSILAFVGMAAVAPAPCERPAIDGRVECLTVRVPENRAKPAARSIDLFVLVARATVRATDDPIFFFTGGPGSAASASAGWLTQDLAALRASRDFVFIDQRGTGRSAPLRCETPRDIIERLRPMFDAAQSAACAKKLSASADLRFYTTSDAALDADDVRRALGYARINVHGSSYGTRAAWAYAARFPSRARTMLLHGPAPPGFYLPLPFARGLDAALDGLVALCAREAACAARFPSLAADVAKAFDRLRAGPVRVKVSAAGGPPRDGLFTYGELTEAVRYLMYGAYDARRLPLLLTRAAAGDYSPIAQASVENRLRNEQQLNRGMFLAVTCAEDVPFMGEAAIRDAVHGTRQGDYRIRQQIAACRSWPRGESRWWRASDTATAPAPLTVPTLVQAGALDPATPLVPARRAMQLLPNGRLMVIPQGAHAFGGLGIDDCLRAITTSFIARASVKGLDTSCVTAAKRPPFRVE